MTKHCIQFNNQWHQNRTRVSVSPRKPRDLYSSRLVAGRIWQQSLDAIDNHGARTRGETVHLVCQENHPDLYEAIGEVWRYDASGNREQKLMREVPFPGRCIMHQPWIGETLPVFVWDKYEEYSRVVPMIELSDDELELYIERNVSVVRRIVAEHDISAIHANHAVLMSVVAQRVSRDTGIPFAVMPHGSDIEYAVKKDERFARYAASAFTDAGKIFVIGAEMRQRVNAVFGSVHGIDAKCVELHLGVDTSCFDPVPRERRAEKIRGLSAALKGMKRGKTREQSEAMYSRLSGALDRDELRQVFLEAGRYDGKAPDADAEERLATIEWAESPTLLFAGRIISMKGVQSVFAALPLILERVPDLRLIVVGHGPLREPMEAFVWALEYGDRALVEKIVAWGKALEGVSEGDAGAAELDNVARFYRETRLTRRARPLFRGRSEECASEERDLHGLSHAQRAAICFPVL